MKKLRIGDSVEFKDGRSGVVEDYDNKHYYVRDNNGNECKICKDWFGSSSASPYYNYTTKALEDLYWEKVNYFDIQNTYGDFEGRPEGIKLSEEIKAIKEELDRRGKRVEDCGSTCKDGINPFTNEGTVDGIIEKTSAQAMFDRARDTQQICVYLSKNRKYLALLQVDGFYMGETDGWEYDTEDGYEVNFGITDAKEHLDLNNVDVIKDLQFESVAVPEQIAVEGIQTVLDTFIAKYSKEVKDCGSTCKDEPAHITFAEACSIISKHNSENNVTSQFQDKNPLYVVAVISPDSFDKEYSLEERSYKFRSDNKYFLSDMIGNSIFADSLDGSDTGVRLDWYFGDWKIEYCYIVEE